MLRKEVESDKEVMAPAIRNKHKGIWIHNSIYYQVKFDTMGDRLAGPSGVVYNGYRLVKALCLCAAESYSLAGLRSVAKHASICSSVS